MGAPVSVAEPPAEGRRWSSWRRPGPHCRPDAGRPRPQWWPRHWELQWHSAAAAGSLGKADIQHGADDLNHSTNIFGHRVNSLHPDRSGFGACHDLGDLWVMAPWRARLNCRFRFPIISSAFFRGGIHGRPPGRQLAGHGFTQRAVNHAPQVLRDDGVKHRLGSGSYRAAASSGSCLDAAVRDRGSSGKMAGVWDRTETKLVKATEISSNSRPNRLWPAAWTGRSSHQW